MDKINFEISQESTSIESYRREKRPVAGVGMAGMWIGAVLTGSDGESYFGCRGIEDFVTGMTHPVLPICGFRKLRKSLEPNPGHLFPEYSTLDFFEPLRYTADADRVSLAFDGGHYVRDADGAHWSDAMGRWELHGRTVSDTVTIRIPEQPKVANEFFYRHELIKVTGRVGDVEVEGHLHHDYAYGPQGMIYSQLPIAREVQGMWVSWVHEYADGEVGGGFFWQGRAGIKFGPGYMLDRGVTTSYSDIVATPTVNEKGQLRAMEAVIGGETLRFEFDKAGSSIHFFGNLVSRSGRDAPVRSWCWVEYPEGKLSPQHLDIGIGRVALARHG